MAYIELTKTDFEETIRDFRIVEDNRAKELIYEVPTSKEHIAIRIYSSVEKFSGVTRAVGEDAIRVVLWNTKDNRPLGKGKRVYRVTSKESICKRIDKAINDFVAQAPTIVIMDWDFVKAVVAETSRREPNNEFVKSLFQSVNKFGRLTEKQLMYVVGEKDNYNRPTMEKKLEEAGWTYEPVFEDETTELTEEQIENVENTVDLPSKANDRVITNTPDTQLVPTAEYPYSFGYFNPVQSLVFPFRQEDCNIIVGASTSAGKTICAEIIMDEVLNAGKKVAYMSPLKSLTQEKYDDWKKRFPNDKIAIVTGDYRLSEEKKAELAQATIIVLTSEMVDSRTRRMESEKNYWLKQIGLLIVDESHILTTGRGHAVETGIMRFTRINRDARIIFLSATMPNIVELGDWLTKLNGKETKVIGSTWRPVQLEMHYVEYNAPTDRYGRENYKAAQSAKKQMAISIIQSKPTEKFLVFCHDKGTGNSLVGLLKAQGIEAKFHNADLDLEDRLEVEKSFADRQKGLRVLVSTSTLAWGRNLPARNVIVVGVHRGLNEVDELDIIQMSGRAGRFGIDPQGDVYLIIPSGSTETWKNVFLNPRPVNSVLKNHQVLAFHVLAEIQNGVIRDARSLLEWYTRSLADFQGQHYSIEDAEGLLDDLEDMEMIIDRNSYLALTGLGKVSAWLYFSPYDVYAWYSNFNKLFEVGIDDMGLAWALTDIPSNDWGYIPREVAKEAEEMRWRLRNRGIQATDAIHFSVAAMCCLTGEEVEANSTKAAMRAIKYDSQRTLEALNLIDTIYAQWKKEDFWKSVGFRIVYGIPEEMIGLVKIPGVGGARAKKMWDAGIQTIDDVARSSKLESIFGKDLSIKIQKAATKLLTGR